MLTLAKDLEHPNKSASVDPSKKDLLHEAKEGFSKAFNAVRQEIAKDVDQIVKSGTSLFTQAETKSTAIASTTANSANPYVCAVGRSSAYSAGQVQVTTVSQADDLGTGRISNPRLYVIDHNGDGYLDQAVRIEGGDEVQSKFLLQCFDEMYKGSSTFRRMINSGPVDLGIFVSSEGNTAAWVTDADFSARNGKIHINTSTVDMELEHYGFRDSKYDVHVVESDTNYKSIYQNEASAQATTKKYSVTAFVDGIYTANDGTIDYRQAGEIHEVIAHEFAHAIYGLPHNEQHLEITYRSMRETENYLQHNGKPETEFVGYLSPI